MPIQAYINFDGNCLEAVRFYEEVFETEEPEIMFYRDMPDDADFHVSEEMEDLVLHTSLEIEGNTIMFSDVPPGMPLTVGNNVSLVILSDDKEKLRSMFNKLKEEGTVSMELQEMFWSELYGYVTDKFGVNWQFDHDTEMG